MKMRAISAAAVLLLAAAPGWGVANAANPPQSATVSPQSARAAQDATQAARQVTFSIARHGQGTVRLYTIGRTRTRVVISIPQGGKYSVHMYPGSECSTNRMMAASAVALTPMNTAVANGQASQAIVALPIEKISNNYVVDVRNATDKAGVIAACAHP
jgi:hypothetical protein